MGRLPPSVETIGNQSLSGFLLPNRISFVARNKAKNKCEYSVEVSNMP